MKTSCKIGSQMDLTHLSKTMKIKKVTAAASFWGQFKFRGDSFLEFEAACTEKDGWTLEERQQFVKEFHEWNGDPEEYEETFLHLGDSTIMSFLAAKLEAQS